MLGAGLTQVLALLDYEAVYLCSRMPADLLAALAARIRVDPIGTDRFGRAQALHNPVPPVIARHVPNHARLACRMALDRVLNAPDAAPPLSATA